jgi:hypothetical protein
MDEKIIYRFGPVDTLDFDKVDAIIYKALQEGQNFDIEFEDTLDDLESYCAVRANYLNERSKMQRAAQQTYLDALAVSCGVSAAFLL